MSRQMSTSPAASQPGMIDPQFESLIDFSEYDNNNYQSPSLSPAAAKTPFARPIKAEASNNGTVMPAPQPLNGPSHNYELYKQQTGIVPGALASTHAANQNNTQVQGYSNFNIEEYLGMSNPDNLFDFNSAPSQGSMTSPDMDMEFDSPPNDFFYEPTVNPNSIGGQEPHGLPSPPVLATQSGPVGRMWPGMHQQAALAKAQAQQRQQQQIIQQQQQQQQRAVQNEGKQAQRTKGAQPTDPIVEQKITQLLNSMRVKPSMLDANGNAPLMNIPRPRKDEEDMDEDERLLASEEGKKLSSKERRQLRNKVSARAFRSRRKEYITQLEAEIAGKVTENGDLRAQNRALIDENKRLSDLTRMLLASPSFSDFLDRLSTNPQLLPHTRPEPQPQPQVQQGPKDVNVYAAQQQMQNHQIGMAMIPEQNMDFSILNMQTTEPAAFNYQPQVYAVLETPEFPPIDTSLLSGKTSNFVGEQYGTGDEKVEMPVIESRPAVVESEAEEIAAPVDEEFENDPQFALYHDAPAAPKAEVATDLLVESLSCVETDSLFGGLQPEKVFARIELVDSTLGDVEAADVAMARVQRISASLESTMARLELLTADL